MGVNPNFPPESFKKALPGPSLFSPNGECTTLDAVELGLDRRDCTTIYGNPCAHFEE